MSGLIRLRRLHQPEAKPAAPRTAQIIVNL
jgi:hypothetical protein